MNIQFMHYRCNNLISFNKTDENSFLLCKYDDILCFLSLSLKVNFKYKAHLLVLCNQ